MCYARAHRSPCLLGRGIDLKSGITLALVCLSLAVAAGAQQAARLVIAQNVAHNLFQRTLPIAFSTGTAQASVIDIAFCGTQPDGSAKVLALAQPGTPSKLAVPVLKLDFCTQPASAVASALATKVTQPAAVVFGSTQWSNWALTITATSTAAVHAAPADSALAHQLTLGTSLGNFSTRRIATKLGNGATLTLDGQIAFANNRMYVALVEAPASAALPAAYVTDGDLAIGENLDARLPLALFNSLSKDQFGSGPFPLISTGLLLSLKGAQLNAATDGLHSTAVLSLGTFGDFDIDIVWVGQDLTIDNVVITPHLQQCAAGDVNCATFNSIRQQTASSYATKLTKQYKGIPLRPTDWTNGTDLTFLGTLLHLSIQNNRASLINGELKFINVAGVDVHEIH